MTRQVYRIHRMHTGCRFPQSWRQQGCTYFNGEVFLPAGFFFILLSGLIPPMTALLAQRLGQDRRGAAFAGLLGLVFRILFNLQPR